MIKKTITYTDFDGNTVTEDHYFHLSKSELIEMELSEEGGLGAKMEAIIAVNSGKEIIAVFRDIIGKAYGQRDPANPSKFFKSEKITEEFLGSLAFDAFFTQLMVDPLAATEFANGLIPKDLATPELVRQTLKEAGLPDPNGLDGDGSWPGKEGLSKDQLDVMSGLKEPRNPRSNSLLAWALREATDHELTGMNRAQLLDVMRRQSSGWKPPTPL